MRMLKIVAGVFAVFLLLSALRGLPAEQRGALTPRDRTARAYENAGATMVVVSIWAAFELLRRRRP